jgi:hypothetical protein
MSEWLKRLGLGLLICGMIFGGCGGDDDEKAPVGPDNELGEGAEEIAFLAGALMQSLQSAFFASLIADPTSVEGEEGILEISGNKWTFNHFSTDGELFIEGELTVDKELFPEIPVKGELQLSGTEEGPLIIDMVVSVQGTDFVPTGTIQLNDEVWDMAEVLAVSSAEGE